MKRKLSGIFFFADNEPVVFEELTDKQRGDVLDRLNMEQIKSLAKKLADTINQIGDDLDIVVER